MSIPVFEPGNTVQFTWVSSVAPNSAPLFNVAVGPDEIGVASLTSVQSTTTAFYSLFTMPTSLGYYRGQWVAQKTFAGSAYDFVKSFRFRVQQIEADR